MRPQPPSVANYLKVLRSLVLFPALCATLVRAVHPVVVKGQDLVNSVTNQRHEIIGVDYQPGGQAGYKPQEGQDVLSNADVCLRDATLIQKLGVCDFAPKQVRYHSKHYFLNR